MVRGGAAAAAPPALAVGFPGSGSGVLTSRSFHRSSDADQGTASCNRLFVKPARQF